MENNKKVREELLNTVNSLSDDELNKEVETNRWSIMQVLEHLHLMEQVVTYSITKQLQSDETKEVKRKPIELTIDRSTKVEAPSFVQPSNDFITLDDMKERLAKSRDTLREVAQSADKELLATKSYPHPIFGDLSLEQWIPFVGYHEKRHIEQIEELKQQL